MSAALLAHIPGITVDEPAGGVLIVTAPDGFSLTIAHDGSAWRFRRGCVNTPRHFHLRRLIDDALNPNKGAKP